MAPTTRASTRIATLTSTTTRAADAGVKKMKKMDVSVDQDMYARIYRYLKRKMGDATADLYAGVEATPMPTAAAAGDDPCDPCKSVPRKSVPPPGTRHSDARLQLAFGRTLDEMWETCTDLWQSPVDGMAEFGEKPLDPHELTVMIRDWIIRIVE